MDFYFYLSTIMVQFEWKLGWVFEWSKPMTHCKLCSNLQHKVSDFGRLLFYFNPKSSIWVKFDEFSSGANWRPWRPKANFARIYNIKFRDLNVYFQTKKKSVFQFRCPKSEILFCKFEQHKLCDFGHLLSNLDDSLFQCR